MSMDMVALSPREEEVLQLVADGLSAKEVARTLGSAPRTVEKHIDNMKLKLKARNAPHLVARAFNVGVLQPSIEEWPAAADHDQPPCSAIEPPRDSMIFSPQISI